MEKEATKKIWDIANGFQTAIHDVEEKVGNKELATCLRNIFDETINELMPTKFFTYCKSDKSVTIFDDEESRDSYIHECEKLIDPKNEVLDLKPISNEEFIEIFVNESDIKIYDACRGQE